jgi:hypothetical protein
MDPDCVVPEDRRLAGGIGIEDRSVLVVVVELRECRLIAVGRGLCDRRKIDLVGIGERCRAAELKSESQHFCH